jgi:pantetheine-phosphate adenylyltransferase
MKPNCAIYPGSFDPVHFGHLDVIARSTQLFSTVIIAVAASMAKGPFFSVEERIEMLRESIGNNAAVKIVPLDGLLVDFARQQEVFTVIRGLRAVSDFEFEFQMALMNRSLQPDLETLFLMPSEEYTYLSSRMVKEVSRLGGDVARFVPECVVAALKDPESVPQA